MTDKEKAQLQSMLSIIESNLGAIYALKQEDRLLEAMALHRQTMTCHHADGRRKTVEQINDELTHCLEILAFRPEGKGH